MYYLRLGFYNAKTGPMEQDEHWALMVRKDSEPKKFDPSRAREDYVYEGWQNTLMFSRRFSVLQIFINYWTFNIKNRTL